MRCSSEGAQTDAYRLRQLLGTPGIKSQQGLLVPSKGLVRAGRSRPHCYKSPKAYEFTLKVHHVEQITTRMLVEDLTKLAGAPRIVHENLERVPWHAALAHAADTTLVPQRSVLFA